MPTAIGSTRSLHPKRLWWEAIELRSPGKSRSRVVAHWNDRSGGGPHPIELGRGAAGILVRTAVEDSTVWTADGRCHRDVPHLTATGVRQLRV